MYYTVGCSAEINSLNIKKQIRKLEIVSQIILNNLVQVLALTEIYFVTFQQDQKLTNITIMI